MQMQEQRFKSKGGAQTSDKSRQRILWQVDKRD
jgi:hypothetical protein